MRLPFRRGMEPCKVDKDAPMSQWKQATAYICKYCGHPACIDPVNPQLWGCANCKYLTYKKEEHFVFRPL